MSSTATKIAPSIVIISSPVFLLRHCRLPWPSVLRRLKSKDIRAPSQAARTPAKIPRTSRSRARTAIAAPLNPGTSRSRARTAMAAPLNPATSRDEAGFHGGAYESDFEDGDESGAGSPERRELTYLRRGEDSIKDVDSDGERSVVEPPPVSSRAPHERAAKRSLAPEHGQGVKSRAGWSEPRKAAAKAAKQAEGQRPSWKARRGAALQNKEAWLRLLQQAYDKLGRVLSKLPDGIAQASEDKQRAMFSEIVSDPASLRTGSTIPIYKRVLSIRAYTRLLIADQGQNRLEHQATVANFLAVAGWQVNRWLDDFTRLVPVEDPGGRLARAGGHPNWGRRRGRGRGGRSRPSPPSRRRGRGRRG